MRSKIGISFALWFMLAVNMLDRVAMSFAGPTIMTSLALTPAQFGIVLSSFSLGYCLSQIPGGLLADRVGSKAMLVGGPIFWAIFTGATGFASTVAGFVAARLFFGISEGLAATSYYKSIGENFEPKLRARMVSICSSAIAIAPAFAGAVIGKLIGAYGWEMMFFIMAVPALISAGLSFAMLPESTQLPQKADTDLGEPTQSLRELLCKPSLWVLSLAALCWAIPYWGYLGWMPSYLEMARGVDLKASGITASIPYVFALAGMIAGGWLGSTIFHRHCPQLVAFNFLCAGISLTVAFVASNLTICLVGLSSAAFFLFGCQGLTAKIVLDLAPEDNRAGYVGIFNTAAQIGGISAPAVIGFLVSTTGTFAGGFTFMIGALAASAICVMLLVPMIGKASHAQLRDSGVTG